MVQQSDFAYEPPSDAMDFRNLSGFAVVTLDGVLGRLREVLIHDGAPFLVVELADCPSAASATIPWSVVQRIEPGARQIQLMVATRHVQNCPQFEESGIPLHSTAVRLSAYYTAIVSIGPNRSHVIG